MIKLSLVGEGENRINYKLKNYIQSISNNSSNNNITLNIKSKSKNSIKENRPNVDDKLRRKPFTYHQTWSKGSQKELDSRDLFTTKN